MSKVDWITWKTDPKEVINPDKIEEKINEQYQNYESYMNSMIYEQLQNEINGGGLSKDAFQITGISPANELATEIIKSIDEIKNTMDRLKNNVRDVSTKQKELEKDQLIDAIEEKIEKEKDFLKNMNSKDNSDEDVKALTNDKIEKLQERLAAAKAL
ncbi:MAG: hypothetical protein IKQ06_05795 [Bacilli bacterium]|nr:hypothetical protein [Bacilli bacterium]